MPLDDERFALGRYRGERLVQIDPLAGVRFRSTDRGMEWVEILIGDRVQFSAIRVR